MTTTTAATRTTTPHTPRTPTRIVLPQVARGFVMGAADIVPGVSGGTIALVLGIYRQLIAALHTASSAARALLTGQPREALANLRAVPWLWLGSLGAGILTVIAVLSGPMEAALRAYPEQLAGLFVGLIAAAVVLCWRQLTGTTPAKLALAAASAVATFVLLGLAPSGTGGSEGAPWWVFFGAGAIAICAMILPGISGSFLLVLMGMYAPVIGAVAHRDVGTLAVFALGCATGLALASSALHWLLNRFHDAVLAAMIGLMVGSIRILWPWPYGLDSTEIALPSPDAALVPTLLGIGGFALVLTLDAAARRLRGATAGSEA